MRTGYFDKFDKLIPLAAIALAITAATAGYITSKHNLLDPWEMLTGVSLGFLGIFAGAFVAYVLAVGVVRRPSVFISYCHADSDLALKISHHLENAGIRILIDYQDVLVGDSIIQRVNELVEKADFIVLIASNNWSKSEGARDELGIVLSSKKRILPLVVDPEAIPEPLRGIKYLNVRSQDSVESAATQILEAVRNRRRHAEYMIAVPQAAGELARYHEAEVARERLPPK